MGGRRLRRIGATLVAVAGLGTIGALATGEVHLVTTHGISMEPRFHTGDLAVIVPAAQYHVGEIVGYHSPLLHIVVLHRIVAEHGGRFTFKGDNNSFLDPVRLPASAIVGRLWLHVPRGGVVLGWFRSPVVLGLAAFFVVAFGVGDATRRRRRRGPGSGTVTPARPTKGNVSVPWWPVAAATAAVALFALFTTVTWTRPTTRPSASTVTYSESGNFAYAGAAPVGVTYPTGQVTTGNAVFLHLVHQLQVRFRFTVAPNAGKATTATLAVRGTIGARATVDGSGTWTSRLASVAPVAFSGSTATVAVPLDLTRIQGLAQSFAQETDVGLVDPEIVVKPTVHISGTIDGAPLEATFAPTLSFGVDGETLTVVGTTAGSGGVTQNMTVAHTGSVARPIRVPAQVMIVGHKASVTTARRLSLGGLVLALVTAVGTGLWWWRRRRMDETNRIHAAYSHDLISVSHSPASGAPLVVDVETFGQLVQLARRYDCMILEHAHAGGHGYYVESGTTIYRCGVEAEAEAVVNTDADADRSTEGKMATSVAAAPSPDQRATGGPAPVDTPVDAPVGRTPRWPTPRPLPLWGRRHDDDADDAAQIEVLTSLAKAEWTSGVGSPAVHLREAVTMAREAGAHGPMIDALLVNVRTAFDEGQDSDFERIEQLEYALELPLIDPGYRARLLGALAVELIFVGATARRGAVIEEAGNLARGTDDRLALIDVAAAHYVARPRSTWSDSRFAGDRQWFSRAATALGSLDDPQRRATIESQAALYALIDGDGAALRRHSSVLTAMSIDGNRAVAGRADLLVQQMIATIDGRLDDAEMWSIDGLNLRRKTGLAEADRLRAFEQLGIRREQGRLAELGSSLADLADAAGGGPEAGAGAEVAAAAFVLAETGRHHDAAIALHHGGQGGFGDIPDDVDWPVAVALWCEVAARVGDLEAATVLHGLLQEKMTMGLCADGLVAGPAARLLALLEQMLGRVEEADRHFAQAIEFSRRLGSPVWVARGELDWAEAWMARGVPERAARSLEAAEDALGNLDLPALRRQADDLREGLAPA
jgi:signal peptidase I